MNATSQANPVQASSRAICTLFDHRYMSRGLVMMNSARSHGFTGEIWALCLSNEALDGLSALSLPGVRMIPLVQMEGAIPGLAAAKQDRTILEYYYTCMAALHRYVLDSDLSLDATMYADSDIRFFCNPDEIFEKFKDGAGAITRHNFPPRLKSSEKFGVYNAGWTAFRRTDEGMRCLDWWLEQSVEYSTGIVDEENDRFANQRYLNRFQSIAPSMRVLDVGCNAAPWNIGNYALSERDGRILLDGVPLSFFHYHGLRKAMGFFYFDAHRLYHAPLTSLMRRRIYRPYVEELVEMERVVAGVVPNLDMRAIPLRGQTFLGVDLKNILRGMRDNVLRISDLASGRPIVALGPHIL